MDAPDDDILFPEDQQDALAVRFTIEPEESKELQRRMDFTAASDGEGGTSNTTLELNKPALPQHSQMSPKDYDLWTRREFAELFNDTILTPEDAGPQRVIAGWRLVREIARHMGRIEPDQMLVEALELKDLGEAFPVDPSPDTPKGDFAASADTAAGQQAASLMKFDAWTMPVPYKFPRFNRHNPLLRLCPQIFGTLLASTDPFKVPLPMQPYTTQYDEDTQQFITRHIVGLPLFPPGVPKQFLDAKGKPLPEYDPSNPKHDPALHHYVQLLARTAQWLNIDAGAIDDPRLGDMGLKGLLDPYSVRRYMPSRQQILTWEALMVQKTLDLMVQFGEPETHRVLYRRFGLTQIEIFQLVKIARGHAMALTQSDVEEDRAMMKLRIEDVIRRARNAMDHRAELAGLKNLAVVLGLARVEPENILSDFAEVVRNAPKRLS